jgi:GTPase Era involved in 16S rRNA processing
MTVREEFKKWHMDVVHLLEEMLTLVAEIYGEKSDQERHGRTFNLQSRINSLRNEEFVVVVLGELNSGKSTFMNALLGKPIFAWDGNESTATIGFLRHNDIAGNQEYRDKAVVHFRDGQSPLIISHAELAEFTTRQSTMGSDAVAKTIEYVDVYADSPFVEDRVTIVDTPGVNTIHTDHMHITSAQIDRSNAAIYLFSTAQPGTRSQIDFLREVKDKIFRFFFLVNRIDETPPQDRQRAIDDIRLKVGGFIGSPNVADLKFYGISALKGLLARYGYLPSALFTQEEWDRFDNSLFREKLVRESYIVLLEDDLSEYLFKGGKARDMLVFPLK